ncbi:MAG: hypothetical protein E6308_18890 [Escherichia coli]|nr:hypothetical protein [Escherichia coli]
MERHGAGGDLYGQRRQRRRHRYRVARYHRYAGRGCER